MATKRESVERNPSFRVAVESDAAAAEPRSADAGKALRDLVAALARTAAREAWAQRDDGALSQTVPRRPKWSGGG